jgi:serine/threonine protein kinase
MKCLNGLHLNVVLEPAEQVRIGRYRIRRRLATGGMAEIFLAQTEGTEGLERYVLLKRLRPQLAKNKRFVRMLLREAHLAATLHHRNIAQVFDMGEHEGTVFVAMEYLHGVNARDLLLKAANTGRHVPLAHALTIVTGVAAGLHYAHTRKTGSGAPLGIVHRDVSPSNIVITYDGAVKLVDFGIARAAERSADATSRVLEGKVGYLSPEQCMRSDVDCRSDVFALGIVLHELTTSATLFPSPGSDDRSVMKRIVRGQFPRPSEVSPGYPETLERIVMKALAVDRDRRHASAEALTIELEDYAASAGLPLSQTVLARYLTEEFGQRAEPWVADTGLTVVRDWTREVAVAEAVTREMPTSSAGVVGQRAAGELPRPPAGPPGTADDRAGGAVVSSMTTRPRADDDDAPTTVPSRTTRPRADDDDAPTTVSSRTTRPRAGDDDAPTASSSRTTRPRAGDDDAPTASSSMTTRPRAGDDDAPTASPSRTTRPRAGDDDAPTASPSMTTRPQSDGDDTPTAVSSMPTRPRAGDDDAPTALSRMITRPKSNGAVTPLVTYAGHDAGDADDDEEADHEPATLRVGELMNAIASRDDEGTLALVSSTTGGAEREDMSEQVLPSMIITAEALEMAEPYGLSSPLAAAGSVEVPRRALRHPLPLVDPRSGTRTPASSSIPAVAKAAERARPVVEWSPRGRTEGDESARGSLRPPRWTPVTGKSASAGSPTGLRRTTSRGRLVGRLAATALLLAAIGVGELFSPLGSSGARPTPDTSAAVGSIDTDDSPSVTPPSSAATDEVERDGGAESTSVATTIELEADARPQLHPGEPGDSADAGAETSVARPETERRRRPQRKPRPAPFREYIEEN